jgi:hypothetical protein
MGGPWPTSALQNRACFFAVVMVHESSARFDYILDHQTLPVNYTAVLAAQFDNHSFAEKIVFVTRTDN